MQSKLTALTNPRWADVNQTQIDCEIKTTQFGDEALPFTASAVDVEEHGRAIFADLVTGKYGAIADFIPPLRLEAPATPPSDGIPSAVL